MQMLIDHVINGVKGKTLIEVKDGKALASPETDASSFVQQALSKEHTHPSPNAQHIKILTFWLRVHQENEMLAAKIEKPKSETKEQLQEKFNSYLQSQKDNLLSKPQAQSDSGPAKISGIKIVEKPKS